MYVDYDSADVWANSHLFILDSNTMKPILISGIFIQELTIIYYWFFRFSR
jgi:hypothetical protein